MTDDQNQANDVPSRQAEQSQLDIRTVVQAHSHDVYRYAYRLAGNPQDAEDLTQQTFLIAQQRLAQVRQPERIIGWLFSILRSCYLKSERKRRPVAVAGIEMDIENVPEDVAEDEVDSQLLQAALNELPEESRLVLVMFYFEDCSYKEIAAELDIPIGTVMSRLARAKERLRKRLMHSESMAGQRGR
jgi:RNA polymerase sigma-70 factor (ECF subfamily)